MEDEVGASVQAILSSADDARTYINTMLTKFMFEVDVWRRAHQMIPTVSYKYFMLSVIGCVHNATICMQRIATENKEKKKTLAESCRLCSC